MIITFFIALIFTGFIFKYFKNNKILLLNFISYCIFILIYLLLKFIFLKYGFITDNSFISRLDASVLVIITVGCLSLIHMIFLYKTKIYKYFLEQSIVVISILISFGFFIFFGVYWTFTDFDNLNNTMLLKIYSDFDINLFIIVVFIIYLAVLYLLGNLICGIIYFKKNKPKINLSKQFFIKIFDKFAYLYRDIFIIGCFIIFSITASDISILYSKYYDRYKNPDYFTNQVYICEDKTKLILEQKYRHHPIVNPYNSFIGFYKQYGKKGPYTGYEINQLHPDKINQDFLQKCISQNGNNYFDEYLRIHGKGPKDLGERRIIY